MAESKKKPEGIKSPPAIRKEVLEIEEALAAYPVLKEGYLSKDGKIFFDKAAALKHADEEDLEVIKSKLHEAAQ